MRDELQRVILVLVGDWLQEEPVEVLLERQIDDRLDRVDPALPRDLRDGTMRALRRVHHENPLVRAQPGLGADRASLVTLLRGLDQTPAQLGVAQTSLLV